MTVKYIRHTFSATAAAIMVAASALLFTGCFTGIEGTSKVKMSREDKKLVKPSDEEILMAKAKGECLAEWKPGKRFYVTDNRLASVLRPDDFSVGSFASDTIIFVRTASRPSPAGIDLASIIFTDGANEWEYESRLPIAEAPEKVSSLNLPMLIDIDYVECVDSLLRGLTVWTLTNDWLTDGDKSTHGQRYFPVKINSVAPGNLQFPLRVNFSDGSADFYMLLSTGAKSTDSRPFAKLFSLSDIKEKYRNISDEDWKLIQQGKVRNGMTKEEVRLSLGAPVISDSGHDYSKIIDIWNYGDGRSLLFEDGILVKTR